MKKIILLAVAVTAMVSCDRNQRMEVIPQDAGKPIGFSAYTGTSATKGLAVENDALTAVGSEGIGVFAFYQPAANGGEVNFNSRKFAAPDFMYNQQVNCKTTASKFEYSPLKYWPNNTGDQVSFFAYAPYKADTTWEDLGFSTDVNATKMTASFPVYNEKAAMQDYLFATPALNRSKQHVSATGDPTSDIITFNFKHIMSRIAINIGSIVDLAPTTTPKAFPQPVDGTGTVITVESIEFKGIAESYDYVYNIASSTPEWKPNGEQDLLLTAKAEDFRNNTSASWTADQWYPLLAQEDSKDAFLFIAPQNLTSAKMVVTYKVATTNASNPADNSAITNVIEKEIGVNFETGKAYVLNLLIGMKTVELSADVVDWEEVTDPTQIDVPENPFTTGGGFSTGPFGLGGGGKV